MWEAWPDLLRIFAGAGAALVFYVAVIAVATWQINRRRRW